MSRRLAASALAALVLAAGCGKNESSGPDLPAAAPPSFVGLVSEDVFAGDASYRSRTLARQKAAGVGLLRQTFDWAEAETTRGEYNFSTLDDYVAQVARRRVELLPVLFDTPRFYSGTRTRRGAYPPEQPAALGRFGAALARRYGPGGGFWRSHPSLPAVPIRAWQVWNEPNLPVYWASGPDPAAYVRLVAATGRAIKRVNPRAEIVSAGLAQSRLGVPFERYVRAMYRAGADSSVDTFAIHPYSGNAADAVAAVEGARSLLDDLGAHPPIWITEIGWASDGPPSPFRVGEAGQARRVGRLLREVVRRRRALGLRGVVYYDWKDAPPYPGGRDFFGLHAGLLRTGGEPKPALRAFERAVRGSSK